MFAYGQTGTGKTHTMEGSLTDEEHKGVIPRSVDTIFDMLKDPMYSKSSVSVSYLEIYNEELTDLLSEHGGPANTQRTIGEKAAAKAEAEANKLTLVEGATKQGKKASCFVKNLSEHAVSSPSEVFGLIARAQDKRKVDETKMNARSSRSHCVFTMTVNSTRTTKEGGLMEATGKLHLVDLAGSECAGTAGEAGSKTQQGAKLERERKNINQSLLTLGRVICTLKECMIKKIPTDSDRVRIPYRDSKLTRLLQESLGGRCKTVIIATLSPSVLAVDETFSTLNYAQQAHGIQNKPVATSYLKMNSALSHGMSFDASADGNGTGDGGRVQDWHEMECRLQYLKCEVEEAQAKLARKHLEQEAIEQRADKAERAERKALDELQASQAEVVELTGRVEKHEAELKVQSFLLATREGTEHRLSKQAHKLLASLESTDAEATSLHAAFRKAANAADEQTARREAFTASLGAQLTQAQGQLAALTSLLSEQSAATRAASDANETTLAEHASTMRKHAEAMYEAHDVEMSRSASALGAAKASACNALNAACEQLASDIRTSAEQAKASHDDLAGRISAVVSSIGAAQTALSTSLQTAVGRQAAAEEEAAAWRGEIAGEVKQGAAKVAERHEAERERFVAHAGALRALLREMEQAKAHEADARKALNQLRKTETADAEAGAARVRACIDAVNAAAAAQKANQKDASLLASLGEAEAKLAAAKGAATTALTAQQRGLSGALEAQRGGNAADAHAASLREAQAAVEAAGAKRLGEVESAAAKLGEQQAALKAMLQEQSGLYEQMVQEVMGTVEATLKAKLSAIKDSATASVAKAVAQNEAVAGVGAAAAEGTKAAMKAYESKSGALLEQTASWGAANDDVAGRIEGAVAEAGATVSDLASATSVVAGAHEASASLVREWADADGACRAALEAVNSQQSEAINANAAATEARIEAIESIDGITEELEGLSEAAAAQLGVCGTDVDAGTATLAEVRSQSSEVADGIGVSLAAYGESSAASRKTEADALSSINTAAKAAATGASDALATALAAADAHAKAHAVSASSQEVAAKGAAADNADKWEKHAASEEQYRAAADTNAKKHRDLGAGEANLHANAVAASKEAREGAHQKAAEARKTALAEQQSGVESLRAAASGFAAESSTEPLSVAERTPVPFTEPFAKTASEQTLREHYAANGPVPLEAHEEPASPARRRSLTEMLPRSASKRLSVVDMAALNSLTMQSLKALATEHDVPIASAKAEMVARLAKAGVKPEGVPRTPRSTPRRPRSMDTGAAENADAADTNTNANANANAPPALKKAVSSSASLDQPAAAASSARPTKIKGTGIRSSRTATAS